MVHRVPVLALAAALAGTTLGCEGPPGEDRLDVAERAPAPELHRPGAVEAAPSEAFESPARDAVGPAEIYYDLTEFGWYRRGEPLLHRGREYHPTGQPLHLPAEQLRDAGDYMGVDYYVHEQATAEPAAADTVFVPVFDGYWLPFVTRAGGAADGGS